MKIAFVIERMEPSRGGRETSTAQMAAELVKRGHAVEIVCRQGTWAADGVKLRPLGGRGILRVAKLGNFIADAQRAVAEGGYDIIHAMLPLPGANVYQPRGGTIPGQIEGSRRLWGAMGMFRVGVFERLNLCRRRLAAIERQVVDDKSVVCLAVSRMVAGEFERYYGRRERVRVVFNAVEIPSVSGEVRADWRQRLRFKLGVTPDEPVFLTIATNFPLKGVAECVRAFARWCNAGVSRRGGRLVVIGRDSPEGYERMAGMRDVGKQVVFLRPTSEVFQWYSAADACVLLSYYDPCSRVVLEATRWGVPCITTAFNGAAEVLAGGAGIVVDSPRDIGAVADAMRELSDPLNRGRRSEACRKVADSLGMRRHVDDLLSAYGEVARFR